MFVLQSWTMRACVWHKWQEQDSVSIAQFWEKWGKKKKSIVKVEAGERTRKEGAVQQRAQRPVLVLHSCHRVHMFPITDISLFWLQAVSRRVSRRTHGQWEFPPNHGVLDLWEASAGPWDEQETWGWCWRLPCAMSLVAVPRAGLKLYNCSHPIDIVPKEHLVRWPACRSVWPKVELHNCSYVFILGQWEMQWE